MQKYVATLFFAANGQENIENDDLFKAVARVYGGRTLSKAEGGYVMRDGTLIVEPAWKLEILFHPQGPREGIKAFRREITKFAGMIKERFKQESVLVTIHSLSFEEFV